MTLREVTSFQKAVENHKMRSNPLEKEESLSRASIAVVGLGYIGLPTAVLLANHGAKVLGIDTHSKTVEDINNGKVTIREFGLEPQLRTALKSGNFRASTKYNKADIYVITVPTPVGSNYDIDMSYISSVVDSISPLLEGGELIVLESTAPPQTTHRVAQQFIENRPDLKIDNPAVSPSDKTLFFAHCPERVLSGTALEELIVNDRVIGGLSSRSSIKAKELYEIFCTGELFTTDAATAEMTKLTENAFRDVNIAFANELSIICDNLSIDVLELIQLANRHPRVNILTPGPGVGGHCIAVDPWFIVSSDRENSQLIQAARNVNDNKPLWVADKIQQAITDTSAEIIAILGLAFKPNIDDLRGSPALSITTEIAERNPHLQILAVDPNISSLPDQLATHRNIRLVSLDDANETAEFSVLLVAHDEFIGVNGNQNGKNLLDFSGMQAPARVNLHS